MVDIGNQDLSIGWDETLSSIVMEWTGFVYGDDFRKTVSEGLDLLVAKKASKWLADLSKMVVIAQEDQSWLDQEWFPRAAQVGIKYIAMVRPEKVLSQMSVRRAIGKVGELEIETAYFDSLEKAKEWIKSKK